MNRKYNVWIGNASPNTLQMGLWLMEGEGKDVHVAKPAELCMIPYIQGDAVPPTLTFDLWEAKEILHAFAEGIKKHGIECESDSKILGILEATKFHLSDMRKLLKLEPK